MKETRSVRSSSALAREPAHESEAPFEMSNLRPKSTGLPMTIWVSVRGKARHGPRIKVNTEHGDRLDLDSMISVTIEDPPRMIGGTIAASDFDLVRRYVALNRDVLLEYWDGQMYTEDLLEQLKPLE